MQLIATDGRGQILLVIFLHIAFNRCSLVSADGVYLIPIDLVGLVFTDVDILIPSYICFLTVAIVLLHHASHILGLGASDFVQLIAADGCGQILLVIFLHIAFNRCGLVSADSVFLIPIDLVGLVFSDVDILIPSHSVIFRTSDIGIKSAVEVLRRLSCHGGGQLAAYVIRHIAGGVVLDIHCIVFDGALFSGIGDIELILLCRGLTVFTLDGFIISLCRIDGTIGILTIFIFQIGLVFAGGLARIGAITLRIFDFGRDTICCHIRTGFCPVRAVPVFGIIERPFFIMGELALGGMAKLCYFSQIRNPIRCDGGSAIMFFTGWLQLIIFQVDLAYIELAIDRQVFLYGDIFLKFCFAFRGQCAIERGIASDIERAADLGILEISIARSELAVYGSRFQLRIPIGHGQTVIHIHRFIEIRVSVYRHRVRRIRAEDDVAFKVGCASHIERAIHIRLFERGIACDRELFIHGHVALEVRSILHVQRACVHFARRGDIAIASIHATLCCQLASRSHIANAIDSHMAFDRSFACGAIAGDPAGAVIGFL